MPFNSRFVALTILAVAASAQAEYLPGRWSLKQEGTTGVSAMMLQVVSESKAIIFDKVQHNELQVDGHVAWSTEYDLNKKTFRPLRPKSNTWCATGGFLGNGTFVSTAGNAFEITGNNGLQGVRLYDPCDDESCDVWENQDTVRLTSPRWYPSSVRVQDGSNLIIGGSTDICYFSDDKFNNPTYEFFPPKNIHGQNGTQVFMKILKDAQGANQYPNVHLLPDGEIFLAVNNLTTLFDWRTNRETRLPGIPNGVKVSSPYSGSAVLLPLTPENNYTPEMLICGGSGKKFNDWDPLTSFSAEDEATDQCIRMELTREGIRRGWQVERMPTPRHMFNMILLPDGRVLFVNGAKTGMAGFNSAQNRTVESNAMNPVSTASIYDPAAPRGRRFSSAGIPTSDIARMYHSTASLTPNGDVILAGSSPWLDVSKLTPFATEYRSEFLAPPYVNAQRPSFSGRLPKTINYNREFELDVELPRDTKEAWVTLVDLGFSTHGVQMDQRLVKLRTKVQNGGRRLVVTSPRNANLYPPGPGFLYIVTDKGAVSVGKKVIIGTGASPPVDPAASANLLLRTQRPR